MCLKEGNVIWENGSENGHGSIFEMKIKGFSFGIIIKGYCKNVHGINETICFSQKKVTKNNMKFYFLANFVIKSKSQQSFFS